MIATQATIVPGHVLSILCLILTKGSPGTVHFQRQEFLDANLYKMSSLYIKIYLSVFKENRKTICRSILLKYIFFFILINERLGQCLRCCRAYVLARLRAWTAYVLSVPGKF